MPVRALYTGSKGKYRCDVCLDNPIHQTSRQQDMITHIKSAHPLTALAWVLRNEPESPETLPVQAGDDEARISNIYLIIVYALHFLHLLIGGQDSTGNCITSAFGSTWFSLSDFSKSAEFQMQIPTSRIQVMTGTTKWPSADDIRKIAGLKFIISIGRRSSFAMKIIDELNKLVGMLKE